MCFVCTKAEKKNSVALCKEFLGLYVSILDPGSLRVKRQFDGCLSRQYSSNYVSEVLGKRVIFHGYIDCSFMGVYQTFQLEFLSAKHTQRSFRLQIWGMSLHTIT